MSNNTIVDPRTNSVAFTYIYLAIDSNGNPTNNCVRTQVKKCNCGI
jgi:hypothetical protein